MKYYLFTNDFTRVKKLAYANHLLSLKLVWSWRYFNFIFRAEYIPIIEVIAPILFEINMSWLKFQTYLQNEIYDSMGCNEKTK